MTGANRVSSLYASVAEAGEDADADALRPAPAGAEYRAGPTSTPPSADAGDSQDGAAAPSARRGQGSEQELVPATKRRARTATAAHAASRKVLLRRAALAGAAIVLLGLGLIVSEENPPAPAEALVPDARTADAAVASRAADEPAATASAPAAVARALADGGADGPPSAAVAPEPEGEAASNEVAAQPEAGQADAPRTSNLPGAAPEGTPQTITSQAAASPAAISHVETPGIGIAASGTAQPAAAPEAAQGVIVPAASTAAPAAAASARALAQGYIVQLGVFGDPDNAAILGRELAAQGYPAHLQSRVVLGPFPDRQAAKAAAERLRGERKLEGIVVPPRKP